MYSSQIELLVGFEAEWIRPYSKDLIRDLRDKYHFDTFVGSVHHVHTVPIDFDKALYRKARDIAGGTDEKLYEDYFDDQLSMLQALRPPVVGHFDLIRLMSDDPERSFKPWAGVWRKIQRNLEFVAGYGGLMEINSAALRKDMSEPYPCLEIAEVGFVCSRSSGFLEANWKKAFLALGGRFVLSDDSHGIAHVGLNYDKVLDFAKRASIRELHFIRADSSKRGSGMMPSVSSVSISELEAHPFWTKST